MVKLTQTVQKGGCAAKVPAMILREILQGLKFPPMIDGVTVDGSHFDDAAIFKINNATSLVQTLDFFTPIVDTPKTFGAIAAANALSDVYAMGGKPKTCMAILAAPLATLEQTVIQDVLQGACDIITQSKSSLVGGHSIDDETLKFGLSVTGLVDPEKIWTNQTAKVGDVLILTKPLGTGSICAGIKRQGYLESEIQDTLNSMMRLNNVIDYLNDVELSSIHAATDITGFGLAGHGYQLALASGVSLKINHQALPVFKKTWEALERGYSTKAHRSNNEYTKSKMRISDALSEIEKLLYFDPQTSGGLLLSVDASKAQNLVNKILPHFPGTTIIGEVTTKKDLDVIVE